MGEDPAIFATALETLAVKAFGDMGQMARLRLIRDRFIAGHSSCELRRHMDSVWESHAHPAVRRVSKPSPDPIYPAYVVGDSDKISETTCSGSDTGACGGEVVSASGGGDTESSAPGRESSGAGGIGTDVAVISFGTTTMTEATTATATRTTRLERSGVFLVWEVGSCSNTMPELGRVIPVYAARMAGGKKLQGDLL